MTANELNSRSIRELEVSSIQNFMDEHKGYLLGRVLDFGAGKPGTCRTPQPYRKLVHGDYVPVDLGDTIPEGKYHVVMCNQVLQYIDDPDTQIKQFTNLIAPGGFLICTYPTNWDEVEDSDLWRFTKAGMTKMLTRHGFRIIHHQQRAAVDLGGFKFPLGYGVVAKRQGTLLHSMLSEDQSIEILTAKLKKREPFYFTKWGDGALECIYGIGSNTRTCDAERYSPILAARLKCAWDSFIGAPNVFLGDWFTANFGSDKSTEYATEYNEMIGNATPTWLHFECLLLHRATAPLFEFYRTIKELPIKKVFVGPQEMQRAAQVLGCRHIVTPMTDLLSYVPAIEDQLRSTAFDLVLYGAGMAGHIPITNVWRDFPNRTYINLGSALDPLYRGKTRREQLTNVEARKFLRGVLT